jgi:hypothetical protein
MKFYDLQVVKTLIDFPEERVKAGEIGTIVCCFSVPNEAYEVEFVNDDGTTRVMFPILPKHLELNDV